MGCVGKEAATWNALTINSAEPGFAKNENDSTCST
jgi:hypothetical protein